jgi:hypothetical protein
MPRVTLRQPSVVRQALSDLGAATVDGDFFRRLMMHLPRLADQAGNVDAKILEAEAHRLAEAEERQQQLREDWSSLPEPVDVKKVSFSPLDEENAIFIFGSLHFLRSYRADAEYFAIRDSSTGRLLSCCGVAAFRWPAPRDTLANKLQISSDEILDLCRMYTLPGSPRNSVSKLLALAVRHLRRTTSAKILTTVVDPNLGFTGSSYRASNWSLVGLIEHPPFRYYKESFRTAGQLVEEFGSMDPAVLLKVLRDEYQMSDYPLQMSQLYAYPLNDVTREQILNLAEPLMLPAEVDQ